MGCSLALAGAALAQQPVEQQSPSKGKRPPEKARATEAQPGANAAKPEATAAKQHGAMKERGATNEPGATTEPGAGKGRKTRASQESATAPGTTETGVSGQPTGGPTTEPGAGKGRKARASQESATGAQTGTDVSGQAAGAGTPGAEQPRKGMKGRAAKTSPTPATTPAAATGAVSATPATAASPRATPATAATAASAAPTVAATGQQNAPANVAGGKKAKPDPQQVQQIKQQHANFRAQPKPQQVPAATFNQNYRIQGSDQWQGQQYEVFRSYRPERHDEGWYRSRYRRVELIGGGYYFWNNGYWFPAWGYSASAEYYPYDGPIYVGQRAEPPDRVIADVQAELQQMGYYQGEVDGLLGPLTRQALTAYQADQGLATTAAIDEPTLNSLGLS
jgi:Putative peptidoglycan binding domain